MAKFTVEMKLEVVQNKDGGHQFLSEIYGTLNTIKNGLYSINKYL